MKKTNVKKWNTILEKERIQGEELLIEMPIIIKFFGVCGLREGNIEVWKKKLEELAFGC